jgi:dihydropteroate synthase
MKSKQNLTIRDRQFDWGVRTYMMGVLNVTPDSFSDGGKFQTLDAALAQAVNIVAAGADLLDIGGESTKPGATPVDESTELARVLPIIAAIRQHQELRDIPISIDTTKASVAQAAIHAGADIVNDVSGGKFDPQMLSAVSQMGVPYILMHMRGTPATMQQMTDYDDVIEGVYDELAAQIDRAVACGIDRSQIILDPGIGFAKQYYQSIELIRQLDKFQALELPLLVGVSRKSFIGKILDRAEPTERLWGTAAACCGAIARGADILRVHDVAEMVDVCRVADVMFRERWGEVTTAIDHR